MTGFPRWRQPLGPPGRGNRGRRHIRSAIAATKTIPIVFTTGFDPVASGLVKSLNRPEANVTGATFYSGALSAKQMEFLIAPAPQTVAFGLLINSKGSSFASQVRDAQDAARTIGRELHVFNAATENDVAFTALDRVPNSALLVGVDSFFDSHPARLIELAARHKMPAVFYLRDFVRAGGLMELRRKPHRHLSAGGCLCRQDSQGRKASRPAGSTADQVRAGHQSQDGTLVVPTNMLATADEVIE
jgi:ABC transporter substrate binding protein